MAGLIKAECACGCVTAVEAMPAVCPQCQQVIHRFRGTASQARALEATSRRPEADPVNHPAHYTSHASGIEVIQITEHMGFCLGNAVKYILRCDLKGNAIEDLKKARWYLDREIAKREAKP